MQNSIYNCLNLHKMESTLEAETIIAIFIALLALGVTLWQLSVQRKHNRMSVKPYLVFNRILLLESPQMTIELKNTGLGPAFIKDMTVYVDGVPFNKSIILPWKDILKQAGIITTNVMEMTLYKYAISAGNTEVIVQAETFKSQKVEMKCIHRIDVKIQYESFYSESFEVRLNEDLS